jgi:HEPN domain-containing protein
MMDPEAFDEEVFGFHAHQAVEKSLKAWIASMGRRYAKTHDIGDLLNTLREAGQDITDLRDFVQLNPFAVRFRYESEGFDDPIDRDDLSRKVTALIRRVGDVVGRD